MSYREIWECAQDGDLEGIKINVLFEGKGIINTERDRETGHTALYSASANGHLPIVRYLVSNGANVNDKTNDGGTALMEASQEGHLPIVQYLISKGANINDKNKYGDAALHLASRRGRLPIVQYLVSNGANINYKGNNGCTPLHYASREHLPIVKYLVSKGANINDKDNDGWTALMFASQEDYLPIVQYLVSKDANINDRNNKGRAALYIASYNGQLLNVQYLISNGANVNNKDNYGSTALYTASREGFLLIVHYLISKGTNINDKNNDGYTALTVASEKGHLPIVQYLISKGAGFSDKTDLGYALYFACDPSPNSSVFVSDSTAIEIIKTLIANGADESFRVEDQTPAENARSDHLRKALTRAVRDKKNGKLQSYVIKPIAPSSTSTPISIQKVILQKERELETARDELDMLRLLFPSSSAASSSSAPAPAPSSTSAFPSNIQYSLPHFSLSDLQKATKNFSDSNKLGEGGFGVVFKGILLRTQVAIKKLSSGSSQGGKEFMAEIVSLSRFRHPNIINLFGVAEEGNERCLVYEIVSNGSLRDRLDRKGNTPPLTWPQRQFIAIGIATGMNYLQNADPKVPFFHLDLKSANVLLDSQFQPKLSDFGLTRPLVIGTDANNYAKTNSFEGDLFYCCPEYKDQGKVSRKTDVYSYGCILIELLSGRFISNQLRSNFRNVFSKRKRDLKQDLDPSISWSESLFKNATDFASLAVDCVDEDRFGRPSFSKILQDLTGDGSEDPVEDAVEDVPERECNICFDGPTDAKFIPCNHAAVCQKCAQVLKNRGAGCPICTSRIQSFVVGDYRTTFVK